MKPGDYVVALHTSYGGDIKEGQAYEVYDANRDHIRIVRDEEGGPNGWGADSFAFLCHDPSELSELERVLYGLD